MLRPTAVTILIVMQSAAVTAQTNDGCEFGDTYQYCDASRCADYPAFRLQECCDTCWDHYDQTTTYTASTTDPFVTSSDTFFTSSSSSPTAWSTSPSPSPSSSSTSPSPSPSSSSTSPSTSSSPSSLSTSSITSSSPSTSSSTSPSPSPSSSSTTGSVTGGQSSSNTGFPLTFPNTYPYNSVYRYQATCTLPCSESYSPGEFNVTISLDKICSNFESFGNFEATQTSQSSVWYLNNTYWIYSDSQGKCQFNVQFDYPSPQQPVPTAYTCKIDDVEGSVLYGWMTCFDVVTQQLEACYNQTLFSQCCHTCNAYRLSIDRCEFGDKAGSCSNIAAKDCYTRENTCCATYNCKYGDRTNCSGISDSDCYDVNTAFRCCETCWLRSNGNISGCTFGDQASNCGAINQWECYYRENECCATCGSLQSPLADLTDCKYGDRYGGCWNITANQCYNQDYQCCETCHYKERVDFPDTCLYGDKVLTCLSSQFHASECYNDNRRDQCCETCQYLLTSTPDCEYGDKNVQCQDIGQAPHVCYNRTVANVCCNSCPELEDTARPGCEYGDTYQYCDTSRCLDYPAFRLQECCDTCWDHYDQTTTYTDSTTDPFVTSSDPFFTSSPSPSPSSTSPSPSPSSSSTTGSGVPGGQSSNSNTLPIVGGVIGGVLVIAVIIIAACLIMRRNKNKQKQKNKFLNLTDINAKPPNRKAPSDLNNGPSHNAMGNPGYNSRVVGNKQQPNRPPPKKQDYKQDEEVYDYIDDSDVRSMPSIKRPIVPDRTEADGGDAYMEPTSNGTAEYFNPTFQDETSKDYHTYHVLQKDANVEREYMML